MINYLVHASRIISKDDLLREKRKGAFTFHPYNAES